MWGLEGVFNKTRIDSKEGGGSGSSCDDFEEFVDFSEFLVGLGVELRCEALKKVFLHRGDVGVRNKLGDWRRSQDEESEIIQGTMNGSKSPRMLSFFFSLKMTDFGREWGRGAKMMLTFGRRDASRPQKSGPVSPLSQVESVLRKTEILIFYQRSRRKSRLTSGFRLKSRISSSFPKEKVEKWENFLIDSQAEMSFCAMNLVVEAFP